MPITTFNNKIEFKSNLEAVQSDEPIDYTEKLINAIDVQYLDTDIYMSKELWLPVGSRGAFGGQIVGQALHAGWNTVSDELFVHSLHCYFILACDVSIPVIYNVQRIRDGRSFATRTVTAKQRGKPIFILTCSFATEEKGLSLDHQTSMPVGIPDPESIPADIEAMKNILSNTTEYPEKFREYVATILHEDQPMDYRDIQNFSPIEIITGDSTPTSNKKRWFKSRGSLNNDMKLHTCVIAYASDRGFLDTAARANGTSYTSENIGMMMSLDHSMWFHKPARADEWLLFDMDGPRSSNGRGVVFGKIYSRDGCLVVTAAQEGIIRLSESGKKKMMARSESESKL